MFKKKQKSLDGKLNYIARWKHGVQQQTDFLVKMCHAGWLLLDVGDVFIATLVDNVFTKERRRRRIKRRRFFCPLYRLNTTYNQEKGRLWL